MDSFTKRVHAAEDLEIKKDGSIGSTVSKQKTLATLECSFNKLEQAERDAALRQAAISIPTGILSLLDKLGCWANRKHAKLDRWANRNAMIEARRHNNFVRATLKRD
jgi:hypothetical protein